MANISRNHKGLRALFTILGEEALPGVRLFHLVWDQRVACSNHAAPTNKINDIASEFLRQKFRETELRNVSKLGGTSESMTGAGRAPGIGVCNLRER